MERATLETDLAVSHKVKYTLNHTTYKSYLQVFNLTAMKTYVYIKTYTWIFISSFICGSPKLETTQVSFDKWMDEQIIVDPYNEILLSNGKGTNYWYSQLLVSSINSWNDEIIVIEDRLVVFRS